MWLSEGRKSFKIGLVVLIQYRLWQTATQQPATQPRRRCIYRAFYVARVKTYCLPRLLYVCEVLPFSNAQVHDWKWYGIMHSDKCLTVTGVKMLNHCDFTVQIFLHHWSVQITIFFRQVLTSYFQHWCIYQHCFSTTLGYVTNMGCLIRTVQ